MNETIDITAAAVEDAPRPLAPVLSSNPVRHAAAIAAELILMERRKQLELGFDAAHDDLHTTGELADAAACYTHSAVACCVSPCPHPSAFKFDGLWPGNWEKHWFRPDRRDPLPNLVKATALLTAEIERVIRSRPDELHLGTYAARLADRRQREKSFPKPENQADAAAYQTAGFIPGKNETPVAASAPSAPPPRGPGDFPCPIPPPEIFEVRARTPREIVTGFTAAPPSPV